MLRKTSYAITGAVLALSAAALSAMPAAAQDSGLPGVVENPLRPLIIHPWAKEIEDGNYKAVAVGRVRGMAGNVMSVEFLTPSPVVVKMDDEEYEYYSLNMPQPTWGVVAGSDIVVALDENDNWVYVGKPNDARLMDWMSRLELKTVPVVQEVSIDWGESKPVALPPVEPRTVAAPAPAPEPIRGMW